MSASLSPLPDTVPPTFRARFPVRQIAQIASELDAMVDNLAHAIRLIDDHRQIGNGGLLGTALKCVKKIWQRQHGPPTVRLDEKECFPVPEVG
jgi:hypothetical protein